MFDLYDLRKYLREHPEKKGDLQNWDIFFEGLEETDFPDFDLFLSSIDIFAENILKLEKKEDDSLKYIEKYKWICLEKSTNRSDGEKVIRTFVYIDNIANLAKKKTKCKKRLKEVNDQISEKTEELIALQTENLSLQEKNKIVEETSDALILSSSLLSNQKQELETSLLNLNREKDNYQKQLKNYEKEVQEYIKIKVKLEIDNEKLTGNNQELQIQLNQQKDKISRLEGDIQLLNNQLNNLEEELEITPTENESEKKTLSQKITFFENWWKKTKQEKGEITENLQKEQDKTQELRQSLTDLEEQLKNTGDNNLHQIQRLSQENKNLKKKLAEREINLKSEKAKIADLEQEVDNKKTQAQKQGLNLAFHQKQVTIQEENNKILRYSLTAAVSVIVLGIFYYIYRKFKG